MKYDFSIDELRLDREWQQHSDRFFQLAEQLADAKRDYEEAENELKLVRAELDLSIREDPKKFDLPEKITETVVASAVTAHSQHQEAISVVRKAKHKVDVLIAAVEAMRHRKTALENLVELHLANYFSTPVAKKGQREETEEFQKRVTRRRTGVRRRDDDDD